jgi:hypothetical protein
MEAFDVTDIRTNSTGVYLTLNVEAAGGSRMPVTVKWSTRHDRFACFHCHTADQCPHSIFARRYARAHPERMVA